jgi:D-serine deaminase-like pyridoxal phosphate-dependent protein
MSPVPFANLDPAAYRLPPGLEQRLHSPALVIFLPQVRTNLERMLAYTGGADRWRPHLKTTKMPIIWRELVEHGVRHFKCATLREARHLAGLLAEMGIESGDLLVAYPLVQPALAGLGRLAQEFPNTRFSVLSETPASLADTAPELGIFIDLNPGMQRTGIPMDQEQRILELAQAAGSRLAGLHYYDGHLHDADLEQRQSVAFRGYDQLLGLVAKLRSRGLRVAELITSGTPAFLRALAYPGFQAANAPTHRVSPGTVVFHDLRSELENPDLDLLPAACLFSRVISHPTAQSATLDAGSKSIAAEAGDPCAFIIGQSNWLPKTPSEEHLPLEIQAGPLPARGSAHWLVPMHVCPTVNLAEEVVLVDGDEFRIETVSARAHDVLDLRA